MKGPSTLVSGGTGFVGRFVVEELLAAGHSVAVMGRNPPPDGYFSRPVRFVEGALDPDRDQVAAFHDVDFFVHAAFDHLPGKYRGGEGGDAEGFWRRNHDGSAALFEAARAGGVKRVVFLSSRAVYGTQDAGMMLTEETRPHPDTLYGEVKFATEQHLRGMSDAAGFCGASLRVTGVYGPAAAGCAHKWAELFGDYLAGKPVEARAGTEVHGDDVAAAVKCMLEAPSTKICGEVFNVSDLLVDRRALLAIVKAVAESENALPDAADGSAVNAMATAKIEALGWRPGGWPLLRNTVQELTAEIAGQ